MHNLCNESSSKSNAVAVIRFEYWLKLEQVRRDGIVRKRSVVGRSTRAAVRAAGSLRLLARTCSLHKLMQINTREPGGSVRSSPADSPHRTPRSWNVN